MAGKALTWGDYILVLVMIISVLSIWDWGTGEESDRLFIEVTRGGERFLYPIQTSRMIEMHDNERKTMAIQVLDQKVWVSESNCLGQYCVQRRSISQIGQWIACLPNKVLIQVIPAVGRNDNRENTPAQFDAEVF